MKKSRLRNKFLRARSSKSQTAYNNQRQLPWVLLKKIKREYHSNLNIKNVIDNRKLCNTVKSFLSEITKKTRPNQTGQKRWVS